MQVDSAVVLNPAIRDLPFDPNDEYNLVSSVKNILFVSNVQKANEELRARHRYLDLRRKSLSRNIQTRSKVAHLVRDSFNENGCIPPSSIV